ncbi:hypothetical protein AAF712_014832 [Marasmius tenuissimus]|uniref:CARMIL C-terminal domain-containing protein n=1 Tax=Marasmius tenuissimus TaxID=585030 RepID=A0ABR2ZDD9_9AGAR
MPFKSSKKTDENREFRGSGSTRSKRRISESAIQQETNETPSQSVSQTSSIAQRVRKRFRFSRTRTPTPEPELKPMEIDSPDVILRSSEPSPDIAADGESNEDLDSDRDIDMSNIASTPRAGPSRHPDTIRSSSAPPSPHFDPGNLEFLSGGNEDQTFELSTLLEEHTSSRALPDSPQTPRHPPCLY